MFTTLIVVYEAWWGRHFSKMIFVAFGKIAKSKEIGLHFSKGRDGIQKVLDSLEEVLEKENIPISASGDYEIFDIDVSPF